MIQDSKSEYHWLCNFIIFFASFHGWSNTSILQDPNWLHIGFQEQLRMLFLTFKALHDQMPSIYKTILSTSFNLPNVKVPR